jgi:hypothetical protein
VLADGLVAGGWAAVLSGAPSTLYSLVAGDDLLGPTKAAGSMVLPGESRVGPLLAAAASVHLALSLGWATVLSALLPRRHTVAWGILAGLSIAALDLGAVGRRVPAIRDLPQPAQVADHIAFGVIAGAAIRRRRNLTGR